MEAVCPSPIGGPAASSVEGEVCAFWEEADGEKLSGAWLNPTRLTVEVDFVRGRHYSLPLRLVPGPPSRDVLRAAVDGSRHGIVLTYIDGRATDLASDFVLYHCEPAYRQVMDARFPKIAEPLGERVGRRVRALRRSRRMSLEQLARAAGMTRGNASRLETGKHEPRLDTLVRVARALGVVVADLVAV